MDETATARDNYDRSSNCSLTGRRASFQEVAASLDVDVDSDFMGFDDVDGHKYDVVQILSYDELLKYKNYALKWCIMHSETGIPGRVGQAQQEAGYLRTGRGCSTAGTLRQGRRRSR